MILKKMSAETFKTDDIFLSVTCHTDRYFQYHTENKRSKEKYLNY